jgi:hypothetical protein
MTAAERRERARLRSERWRRAHGIGPRRPAQKPWLAEGCSRSTWYRRGNRVRERAAVVARYATRRADRFARAEVFVRQLQAELAEVARCQAVIAAIMGELGAIRTY